MQRESRGIIAVSIQSSMVRGEVLWFRKIEGRRKEEKRKSGQ